MNKSSSDVTLTSNAAFGKAQVFSWEELFESMTATVYFTVTADNMRCFAELSGDYNPLHLDHDFARQQGFPGAIVYGGLLVAKISQLIGMRLPGRDALWISLDLKFRKPLFVGQPCQAQATIETLSESTKIIGLRLIIRSEDVILVKGRAEVLLVNS